MIGESISHYRIVGKLGSGGMGEVYLAEDTSLRRKVAVKFLSPEKQQDQSAHFRILREARSAACLEHANICTIHEIGSVEGKDFIVMEYVEGQTLKDRLAAGPLPLQEALHIICDIAEALEEAHEKGIIHKDLKPGNIMITRKGQAKVMDFGLAMKSVTKNGFESSADTVTQTVWGTQTGGTPAYMSPEQLLGESIDDRADIFSLGIVFYEMLAGTHPFLATTSAATSDRILHEEPGPVSKINPAAPEEVGTLISRMMAKDPKDRPGSARELLEDLHAVRGSDQSTRSRRSWIHDFARHRRRVTVVLSIGLLLLLAGALYKMRPVTRSEEPNEELPSHINSEFPSNINMALLPFEAINGTDKEARLAKGLMETINAQLTKVTVRHPLQITPANKVNEEKVSTVEEAYRVFGVNLVLTGNLHWAGEQVRFNYIIFDAETGKQLRGDSITTAASDSFELEDQATNSILNMLGVKLEPEEESFFAYRPTEKPEAFTSYMTALGYLQDYQIQENVQSAIDELQDALKQDPKFALAYAALGEAHWYQYLYYTKDMKFVGKALDFCNEAVRLDSNLANGHSCLGAVFTGTGKYEQAAQEYRHAVRLDPSSDAAYRGLGSAYEALGVFNLAEETYRQAITLRPEYWAGYNLLGVFYTSQGRYEDAAKQFEKVIELTPRNYLGFSNLGGVYLYEGRYKDAIRVLKDSVALRPTESAYSNLGSAYFYQRMFSEAAGAYLEARRHNERSYVIWGNLGDAYYWDPENRSRADAAYRQALSLGEQGLRVNPRNAILISYMAYYHAMLNEKEKARNSAKTAYSIDQKSFEVLFNLAQTSCRLGDTDQALDWLKKAIAAGLSGVRVRNTPLFDPLKTNPEFQRLLKGN